MFNPEAGQINGALARDLPTQRAGIINRASELGPQTIPWWKDWRGQACAIIASGPSTRGSGFEKLRGRMPVIAIKENAYDEKIAPWADIAYGCDHRWWKYRRGLQGFKGLKIGFDPKIHDHYKDVNLVRIPKTRDRGNDRYTNDFLLDEAGVIGGGCNSGFQTVNLAVQFGASRILLVGFDLRGDHWYGRNNWEGANNAGDRDMLRWCSYIENAKPLIERAGAEVLNASPHSALKCFRKTTVDEALREWGL